MLPTPNLREANEFNVEGVVIQQDAVTLELSDVEVIRAIGNRVNFSKTWWNKEENLDSIQKRSENVWLNLCSADIDLYDFEEPYAENRIFVAIETLISQVVGRAPQPMISEAQDTDASRDLARIVEKRLLTLYHDQYQKADLEMIARHLLTGFRFATLKYRWDNTIGRLKPDGKRSGGIVTEVVRPDKLVFDAGATDKDNIPLIAEYMQASSDDLCYRYQDKQDDIMKEIGLSYGTASKLTDLVTYLEVHFTGYREHNGEEYEGVAVKFNNLLLDKFKNPNYNYDEFKIVEGKPVYLNFFDKPKKPYVIFNFLNQGKYIVDSISLTDQTYHLQRQLEKRGRQIDYNADMANAGLVINANMVTEENASKLVGDPGEKLMAKGDVTKAATRLPPNTLEPYVISDKVDIRGAIDTIFGANAPLQGSKSGNPTLGQDELSVQRNTSRLGTLATTLENGMHRVYGAEIQLMKVFGGSDEEEFKYSSPDGHTEFLMFSNQTIENGVGLRVREGSVLPDDPATQLQIAEKFLPKFDPLTLAEYLNFDDPKKKATQMFMFAADAAQYGQKYLGISMQGDHDPDAVNAIQQISQGQQPQVPDSPSSNYVAQLNSHMQSPEFAKMSPVAQAQMRDHSKQVVARAREKLGTKPQVTGNPGNDVKKPGILGRFGQAVKQTLFS